MLLQLVVVMVMSFSVSYALVTTGQRRWGARSLTRANRCYLTRATVEVVEETSTLAPLPPLKNRYFAVRHGQSTANLESIISSDPNVGTVTHGLTPLGREQARRSAAQLTELLGDSVALNDLVVVSSDFTRARETAEEALTALQVGRHGQTSRIILNKALRERWFGDLDAKAVALYNDVWPKDLLSAKHTTYNVESVESVASRIREMFLDLESAIPKPCASTPAAHLDPPHDIHAPATRSGTYTTPGTPILLASHADTLQIMQVKLAHENTHVNM